jgi:hypothetical protein
MDSVEAALDSLNAHGFRFVRAPGEGPEVPFTLLYLFAWSEPFIDAVHVRAENDATAARACVDGPNDNLFALENIVWKCEGRFADVVNELLKISRPGMQGAPARTMSKPSSLWTPSDGDLRDDIPRIIRVDG